MSDDSEWNLNHENYLNKLQLQCSEEYHYFNRNFLFYFETSKYYSIPILILSAVNSIISSIQMFLKINENMTNSLVASIKFHKLSVKICKELSIKRQDRKTDGNTFLNECYGEYIDAIDRVGAYQRKIKNFLVIEDTRLAADSDFGISPSDSSLESKI